MYPALGFNFTCTYRYVLFAMCQLDPMSAHYLCRVGGDLSGSRALFNCGKAIDVDVAVVNVAD